MESKEIRRKALSDELHMDVPRQRQLQIIKILNTCRCRNCGDMYQESKSRADFKGYCTAACLHEKARKLGFKKRNGYGRFEHDVLRQHNAIGSVFVDPIYLEDKDEMSRHNC